MVKCQWCQCLKLCICMAHCEHLYIQSLAKIPYVPRLSATHRHRTQSATHRDSFRVVIHASRDTSVLGLTSAADRRRSVCVTGRGKRAIGGGRAAVTGRRPPRLVRRRNGRMWPRDRSNAPHQVAAVSAFARQRSVIIGQRSTPSR